MVIYTLTLNPAIDLFIRTNQMEPGQVNRTEYDELQINGKGVNVSLVFKEKDRFIEKIGEECEKEGIPFVLEILTYDQYETEEYSKPRKVIKSMKHFSKPKFKIDVLKVELPVDIRLVEGYVEDYKISRKDAKKYFKQQARASHLPYIFLSAGVSPELFRESLILARDNGSKYNGVLCGRATWAGVVKEYLEYGEDAARKWLQTEGRKNLKELNKCLVETATAIESEKG